MDELSRTRDLLAELDSKLARISSCCADTDKRLHALSHTESGGLPRHTAQQPATQHEGQLDSLPENVRARICTHLQSRRDLISLALVRMNSFHRLSVIAWQGCTQCCIDGCVNTT